MAATLNSSEWTPATQVMLGLGRWFGDSWFWSLEYKYITQLGEPTLALDDGLTSINSTYNSHRVSLRARIRF